MAAAGAKVQRRPRVPAYCESAQELAGWIRPEHHLRLSAFYSLRMIGCDEEFADRQHHGSGNKLFALLAQGGRLLKQEG